MNRDFDTAFPVIIKIIFNPLHANCIELHSFQSFVSNVESCFHGVKFCLCILLLKGLQSQPLYFLLLSGRFTVIFV